MNLIDPRTRLEYYGQSRSAPNFPDELGDPTESGDRSTIAASSLFPRDKLGHRLVKDRMDISSLLLNRDNGPVRDSSLAVNVLDLELKSSTSTDLYRGAEDRFALIVTTIRAATPFFMFSASRRL